MSLTTFILWPKRHTFETPFETPVTPLDWSHIKWQKKLLYLNHFPVSLPPLTSHFCISKYNYNSLDFLENPNTQYKTFLKCMQFQWATFLHVPTASMDIFLLHHINQANTTRLYTLADVSFVSFYSHNISILVLRFYVGFYQELST